MTAEEAREIIDTAVAVCPYAYDIVDLEMLWDAIHDAWCETAIERTMSREEIKDRLYDLWADGRIMVPEKDMIEPIVVQAAKDMGLEVPGEETWDWIPESFPEDEEVA